MKYKSSVLPVQFNGSLSAIFRNTAITTPYNRISSLVQPASRWLRETLCSA